MEDICVTGLIMHDVLCPVVVNTMYFCGKGGKDPVVTDLRALPVNEGTPHVRRILIADCIVTGARSAAGCIYGLPEAPIEDFSLLNTTVHLVKAEPEVPVMNALARPVTCAGLTAEHVRGLTLQNFRITGAQGDAIVLHDVETTN